MSRQASQFAVYSCEGCGKRIFTDRAHLGRKGICPCCGVQHVVGGAPPPVPTAEKASDRRGSGRFPAPHGRVAVGAASRGELDAADLHPLGDLSEDGLAFKVPAVRDRRHVTGFRPPPLEKGQVIEVTLHAPELLRPRKVKAEVRRITPAAHHKDRHYYTVGCRFLDLAPEQQAAIGAMVAHLRQQEP